MSSDKTKQTIMNEYSLNLDRGAKAFERKYNNMFYSAQARRGIMPADIKNMSIDTVTQNASMYIFPSLQIVSQQLIKELTVNNPQFKIRGNNVQGKIVEEAFNSKLSEFLSRNNFGYRSKFGYQYGFDRGTIIERTIFREIKEEYSDPNIKPMNLGGSIYGA